MDRKPTYKQKLAIFAQSDSAILLLCTLITVVLMYNYVFPLNSLLYTTGIKGQDCGQMIWNLWFANEAITHGHSPFGTDLLFYPFGANLAHHTLAAGFFPLTFIVKKLSGNDPLYPFYAFKIIILVSFILIFWFSFLFLRECGMTRWPALIAAVGYAFSDFYVLHVIHINHLAGFFIPLTALFLLRAYRRPASLNLLWAALAASCSVYFTEFSIYICMAALCLIAAAALFQKEREQLFGKISEAGFARVVTATTVFLLIVAPFSINLFRDKIVNPPPDEPSHYSANLAGFIIPGQERDQAELDGAPLTTPLYGRIFASLDSHITMGIGGFETFVGFPLLLFSLAGLAGVRQRMVWFCAAIGMLFFALSLGPTLKILGSETGIPMPYSLLMKIPPFDTGRTPVRFVVMGLFFLMIVAAFGLDWTRRRLDSQWGPRFSHAVMALICLWAIAEVYSPTRPRQSFVSPSDLTKLIPGSVLNLPPVQRDGYAAMLQTFHHQPIGTGYLARNNENQWARFAAFKTAFDKGGADFCQYVQSNGFRNIVIAPDSVTEPNHFSMAPLDLPHCPINVVDLREPGVAYSGTPGPYGGEKPTNYPLYTPGTRLQFGTAEVDEYLWYGWSGREPISHWTDRGFATLTFALAPEDQRHLTLKIFGAPFLAPGKLDVQEVVVDLNHQAIADLKLSRAEPQVQTIEVPQYLLRDKNILLFVLPNASSPKSLGVSADVRLLGLNVQWLEID